MRDVGPLPTIPLPASLTMASRIQTYDQAFIPIFRKDRLPLHQKIDLLMPDTTNSLIEQEEVVKPCHEPCEGLWPNANNPPPNVTRHGLQDSNLGPRSDTNC